MALTRLGKTITMTAATDDIAAGNYFFIAGMTLQVAGGVAGERLLVKDAGGSILADYLVMAATDNADLWNGREPTFADGIDIANFPTGTAVLTIFLA